MLFKFELQNTFQISLSNQHINPVNIFESYEEY